MFIWTGWAFGGNDYEVSSGNRGDGCEGGARHCARGGRWLAGQCAGNGDISLLGSNIMLKVNGSWRMEDGNDSGPVSWNEISPSEDVEIFNMSSAICKGLLYPSWNIQKLICVTEAMLMGHKRSFLFCFSKLEGLIVYIVSSSLLCMCDTIINISFNEVEV